MMMSLRQKSTILMLLSANSSMSIEVISDIKEKLQQFIIRKIALQSPNKVANRSMTHGFKPHPASVRRVFYLSIPLIIFANRS